MAKRGDNKSGRKIAIVAVARTLLSLIWGLLYLKKTLPVGLKAPQVRTLQVKLREMDRRAKAYTFLETSPAEALPAVVTGEPPAA